MMHGQKNIKLNTLSLAFYTFRPLHGHCQGSLKKECNNNNNNNNNNNSGFS